MPVLESVGTAVPEHRVEQDALRDLVHDVVRESAPDLADVVRLFDNTRISTRYFAQPLEWYLQPHDWSDRANAFVDAGLALAEAAAREALAGAGGTPRDVDAVVFVTTTGIATPSLDARLVNAMGLREDVVRVPVWGLGCAGGVAGLSRARDLALADPERRVLLVALELCSLQFLLDRLDKKALVAAGLFSDGCAAALVTGDARAEGDGVPASAPALRGGASHLFPGTERVMGWDVRENGLDVVISPRIPRIVRTEVGGLVNGFLKTRTDGAPPARWLLHPGGARVVDAYVEALGLPPAALVDTNGVLNDYGNMSSPTVLFVAQRSLERQALARGERALLAALGPGFASEMHLIEGR